MLPESETRVVNPIRQQMLSQTADQSAAVAATTEKIKGWTQEIEAVQQTLTALSEKEPLVGHLTREKTTYEDRFKTLKAKLLELEVQRLTQMSDFDVKVVDPARGYENVPSDWPRWDVCGWAVPCAGLVLSLMVPFLLHYLSGGFLLPSELATTLGVPVLGTVAACRPRGRKSRVSHAT